MTDTRIHQIYYSEQTRAELDPGFLALDNSANERPDWREYWPMRRFLLGQELEPESYYGFFSPKFKQKTTLTAATVDEFVRQRGGNADVISFSPFFDQMAFPLNIFELAVANHDCRETFAQSASLVAPGFDIERSVMSSLDTVYCNFFVATPRFWREWLAKCEIIFDLAEQGLTPLGQALNRVVTYGTATAPAKVFVIERVTSLLLWSQKQWTAACFNSILLPQASARLLQVAGGPDLMVLDALKVAYAKSGTEHYLALYRHLRDNLIKRANGGAGASTAQSSGTAHSPPASPSAPVTPAPRGASRYDREIKVDANDPLARFAQRLPAGATVLDLGCGPGVLGRLTASLKKPCTLDAVEGDPEAVAMARGFYRDIIAADLQNADLAAMLPGRKYDFIVLADVIEHLEAPGRLLRRLPALLGLQGRLLISLPHIGYAGLVAELLTGQFAYRPHGLIDRTHLRFFTRASAARLLTLNGFAVAATDDIVRPPVMSEFGAATLDALDPAVRTTLLTRPDALLYQMLIEAAPSGLPATDGDLSQALIQRNVDA
ncbi:MAG TPA: class I SAM-dependent methyltransferase [Steroidobacteraceae bacterium]|nr:class I SAM-dependent methyltransferase [Steroidobacteraceae bacterium]